jgi:hypothetical protein
MAWCAPACRAAAEEEREQAKRRAAEAAKHKFRSDLERQMKENVAKRRWGQG